MAPDSDSDSDIGILGVQNNKLKKRRHLKTENNLEMRIAMLAGCEKIISESPLKMLSKISNITDKKFIDFNILIGDTMTIWF
jgi:hypothetical protein